MFQDPTYFGFKLFFHFDQPDSGLLSTVDHPNTALGYLNRIGDTLRAQYLTLFVDHLKNINSITPWFFQTVDGLTDAWTRQLDSDEFKPLLSKDRKITIGCLEESIDLRITALMDLYRKACFDWPNRREIVPKNLRQFKFKVYLYEARQVNRGASKNSTQISNTEGLLGKNPVSENEPLQNVDIINPNINRVMFDFGFCEFLADSGGAIFDGGVSHREMKTAFQKIEISYRTVLEDNIYNIWSPTKRVSDMVTLLLDTAALDNPQIAPKFASPEKPGGYGVASISNPGFNAIRAADEYLGISDAVNNIRNMFSVPTNGGRIGNVYGLSQPSIPPIAQAALNEIESTALGQLNNLLLGNVYGFGVGDIQALGNANPASLAAQAISAIQGGNNGSLANASSGINANIGFSESVSNANKTKDTDEIGNIYQ
jgi:hypothetical protein